MMMLFLHPEVSPYKRLKQEEMDVKLLLILNNMNSSFVIWIMPSLGYKIRTVSDSFNLYQMMTLRRKTHFSMIEE